MSGHCQVLSFYANPLFWLVVMAALNFKIGKVSTKSPQKSLKVFNQI